MKSAPINQLDLFSGRPQPAPQQKEFTPGSQLQRVHSILISKPIVENLDFRNAGIEYIARNKVSELRKMGYVVAQRGSGTGAAWLHNQYSLIATPAEQPAYSVVAQMRAEGWNVYPEERRAKL